MIRELPPIMRPLRFVRRVVRKLEYPLPDRVGFDVLLARLLKLAGQAVDLIEQNLVVNVGGGRGSLFCSVQKDAIRFGEAFTLGRITRPIDGGVQPTAEGRPVDIVRFCRLTLLILLSCP